MSTLEKVYEFFKATPTTATPQELPDCDRDTFATFLAYAGLVEGVELGVEQGVYSEVLLKANPSLHLHAVDPWLAYSDYREHVSQSKLDGFFESTKARLKDFHVTYHRATSADALADFPDNSLDFVYIDANHTFAYVAHDVVEWSKKVRPGGIISGHDFRRRKPGKYQCHVVEVITAFTEAFGINPWFVLGSKDVVPGQKRDSSRSYFWVKE